MNTAKPKPRRRSHPWKETVGQSADNAFRQVQHLPQTQTRLSLNQSTFNMKVIVKSWHAVAYWRWDTGNDNQNDDPDGEEDVCGICRVPYEGCCPTCKMPGDDCPLIWGECSHIFHMHCLLKWLNTGSSKQQCPMDRRPWVTAERKVPSQPRGADAGASASAAPPRTNLGS